MQASRSGASGEGRGQLWAQGLTAACLLTVRGTSQGRAWRQQTQVGFRARAKSLLLSLARIAGAGVEAADATFELEPRGKTPPKGVWGKFPHLYGATHLALPPEAVEQARQGYDAGCIGGDANPKPGNLQPASRLGRGMMQDA
jgi:hypothetical protein